MSAPTPFEPLTRTFVVVCPHGIHLRIAARIVALANHFQSAIWFSSRTRSANTKSILSLLELGLVEGDSVTMTARGPDAEPALEAMEALVGDPAIVCGDPAVRSPGGVPVGAKLSTRLHDEE